MRSYRFLFLSLALFASVPTETGCGATLPTIIQVTEKILVDLAEAQAALQAMKTIVDHLIALRPDLVSNHTVRKFYLAEGKAEAALQHASQATQSARKAGSSPDPLTVFAEFKAAYSELAQALAAVEALAKTTGASGVSFQVEVPEAAR